jgi:HK97 family phage major capsid protein
LDELDEAQEDRFEELTGDDSPLHALRDERTMLEKRLKVIETANGVSKATEHGDDRSFQYMKQTDTRVDIRTASRVEARDAALKVLETEHKNQTVPVSDASAAQVEKLIKSRTQNFDGDYLARRLLVTETDAYRSAFGKAMYQPQPAWDQDEIRALNEFRAAEQSLTSASGGYGVPVLIDPSIILTSGAGDAPILSVSRIERITNNAWKGVSSAGVAFANEVESDPIAAQQATFAQPSITAHKIAAFIPFSFEIEGDYPGFASEMQTLIEQAYVDYLAVKTMTGTGTIEPWGIFTAIDQTAGSEVTPTTDGALGPVDALKVWGQLPERARARATWVSNVTVQNAFRNNGSTDGFFSVDLTENNVARMLGRPYILSDYAPAFTGTTGASNLVVVGDFNKYVIAQRVGMNVELIPHVFDGDGLPKGQRGWLAWARVGADSVDDAAFRLLQNA